MGVFCPLLLSIECPMAACSFSVFCGVSSFTEKWIPSVIISHRYKAQDTPARRTFEQALTGAFMSAVIKDLRPSALPFVASLIRHYTMVAVAQQCGERINLSLPVFLYHLHFGLDRLSTLLLFLIWLEALQLFVSLLRYLILSLFSPPFSMLLMVVVLVSPTPRSVLAAVLPVGQPAQHSYVPQ